MKKKLIALFAACTLLLTGCGNNTSSQTSTEAATTTTASPETTPEETSSDIAPETTPEPVTDSVPEENADTQAGNAKLLADAVLNAVEWPKMGEQTDAFMLSDYFGLDITLLDDFCVQQNMMSTHLNEVIVTKPTDGNMDAVKTALNAHLEKLRTELAFYPAQTESANAAIVNEHNGYVYLICHIEAETAEEALIEAIDAL